MSDSAKQFMDLWEALDHEGRRAVSRALSLCAARSPLFYELKAYFDENKDRPGLAHLINAWLDEQGVEEWL